MTQMDSLWFSNPTQAYQDWQAREAAGADRRPFSARSIIQHQAMFEHFRRHLLARGTTIASFGTRPTSTRSGKPPDGRTYFQATRMRYVELLDRLCRHLVFAGVGRTAERLPDQEPTPQFLSEAEDRRLQAYLNLPPVAIWPVCAARQSSRHFSVQASQQRAEHKG
ncbi:hypothetical protein [Cupriavidus sp. amp6]|uniref:hypothetical protein n=1 Tax=Cupriavidus sp. amp6 TaxID=388051 RepID=UPI001E53D3E4|nr:hypothetical protein [Cupriavidus sp. amp6]